APGHKGAVTGVAFHPSSNQLISVGQDGLMKGWPMPPKPTPPTASFSREAHPGGATGVVYHTNGTQAVSVGADKKDKLWDLAAGKEVRAFGPLGDPANAIALSKDGNLIAAAGGKIVKIFNAADGKEMATLTHPGEVTSLSFNPDKSRIVTGSADNVARVC